MSDTPNMSDTPDMSDSDKPDAQSVADNASTKTQAPSDLFPTYSDGLYAPKPKLEKPKKKLRGSIFRSLWGGVKLIVYALVGGWFVYTGQQEHKNTIPEVTTYYNVETIITKPSRDSVRELLIPRVQEDITADSAFNEFNTQLALILSAEVTSQVGQPLPDKTMLAIGEEGDKSLAAALVVDTAHVEASVNGLEETSGTHLSLSAYDPRVAVTWMQKRVNAAAEQAREVLVEKTFNKVEQRILEIKGGYSDQLQLGQRESEQRIKNLQASINLAKTLGVLLPIQEPHPLQPEGAGSEYMQGVRALEKQLKVLQKNYAQNALLDESSLVDEELRLELDTLEKVDINPRLVVTATANNPYIVDKVVDQSEHEFSIVLALIKGLLVAWVGLFVLSMIFSGLFKLKRK